MRLQKTLFILFILCFVCNCFSCKNKNIATNSYNLKNFSTKNIAASGYLLQYYPWQQFKTDGYTFIMEDPKKKCCGGMIIYDVPYFLGIDQNHAVFAVIERLDQEMLDKGKKSKVVYISINLSTNTKRILQISIYDKEIKDVVAIANRPAGFDAYKRRGAILYMYNNGTNFIITVLDSQLNKLQNISFSMNSISEIRLDQTLIMNNSIYLPLKNRTIADNKIIPISENLKTLRIAKYWKRHDKNIHYRNIYGENNQIFVSWENLKDKIKEISVFSLKTKILTNIVIEDNRFYDLVGIDKKNKYYFTDIEGLKSANWDYTRFTNKIIAVNFDKKTQYIIKHSVPGLNTKKKKEFLLTDYQVNDDGSLYCCYMHKNGVYIYKIQPDWGKVK